MAHAYEDGELIRYQVSVEERDGSLVVGVCDQGLSFSLARLENPVFNRLDSVRLARLGGAGKRLEMLLHLPEEALETLLTESDRAAVAEPPVSAAPIQVRSAEPADAVGVARCVYRCYGRSYGSQYLYLPERLKRMWEQGTVVSVVAVADEEIVGHLCYWLENSGDPAGQSTDAVVDPRFRGRHVYEQMKKLLIEVTRAQRRLGMISEAVTVHPYTQKGVLALGAVETGLMLGDLPATLDFKAIEDTLPARQSCMLCYLRLNQEPARDVFLPVRHREMLEKIYSRTGLARSCRPDAGAVDGLSEVELHLDTGWGEALLRVVRFGTDVALALRTQLSEALAGGAGYVYLELPLVAGVDFACRAAEEVGFTFAGLVPEAYRGDVLRMHYLRNLRVDPNIATASDWGEEIRLYVTSCAP